MASFPTLTKKGCDPHIVGHCECESVECVVTFKKAKGVTKAFSYSASESA